MFLREAVERCAEIESSIAGIYDELSVRFEGRHDLADLWAELARRERMRSRVLRAAGAAEDVLDNDGPFLVHVPLQLANLRRVVDEAYRRVRDGMEPGAALQVLDAIEAAERNRIYTGLIELIRPDIAKVLRMVDTQSVKQQADEGLMVKLREAAGTMAARG